MKIDAHQHFWKYDPVVFDWITEEMSAIREDFMPEDLEQELRSNDIDGCVAVQADQSERETEFLLSLAEQYDFIKGVVGWVDLLADDLQDRLAYFSENKWFKGVRHIMQAESPAFITDPGLKAGVKLLGAYNLTYDVLIFHDQLDAAIELVNAVPETKMVLDHIGKPDIKSGKINEWHAKIVELSKAEHISCKLSGMVTEADWSKWEQRDIEPYVATIFEAFGAERIMFGSDWPVCKLAGEYSEIVTLADALVNKYAINNEAQIWGQNAVRFYNLK